jgi:lipopolysaccharide/colanic/teichoic acid biosynthesis glycosyltransferase
MSPRSYAPVKRILDTLFAAVLLLLMSPLMAIVGVVVLIAQRRPVLFVQTRPGLLGKSFRLYKFRTMDSETGPLPSQTEVARLTPLGRFLRKLSLDELPQLWNVVKGDMSMVGPRPLLTQYLPLYDSRQATRHTVRPGLTGLAQVNGRNALTWAERLELDAQYVETFSFFRDVGILLKSFVVVFLGRGVNPERTEMMKPFRGSSPTPKVELG